MGTLLSLLAGVAQSIAGGLQYLLAREGEKNSPTMRAAAAAATDQQIKDRASADVAAAGKTGNLDQIRKDAAE